MKVRNGFVSNSSSSSYILAFKRPMTNQEIVEELLVESKVTPDSFIYEAVKEMCEVLVRNADPTTISELVEQWSIETADLVSEELMKKPAITRAIYHLAFKNDWEVREGAVSNEDEPEEYLLCEMELHIDTDSIFLEKDGKL